MKTKKAGLMTKLVVLALLIYMATSLLDLRTQIQTAQSQLDDLDLERLWADATPVDLTEVLAEH